jgi:DHA2 family multidrug resistance protein
MGASAPRRADGSINWTALLLGFGAMVVGHFMAVLDIQIVSASLPEIQAGIGASADEVSWIQTSYLIAEVVMIPLAGFLSRLWGTRPVFLISCAGFTVMSVATGLATSMEQMILFRALQGFIGGAMIPTVFAVAFSAFPPERRLLSSLIMSMIISLAPTVGPTLGGHLTDWLSWRWLFFINVPPGILVMVLVWRYGAFDKGDSRLAKGFDWTGLALMAVFLMSMQYVLEEAPGENWFESDLVLWLTVTVALAGAGFIWRQLAHPNPIIELRCFRDSNFVIGLSMSFVSGIVLFGGTFLIPQYLGLVRGYSAGQIGTVMVVAGLGMMFTGPIAGRLAQTLDARIQMLIGFGVCGLGFWLGRDISDQWGFWEFAGLQALRSFGLMMAMLSTQNVTMASLPGPLIKSASGLINLARNTGGAVGLALISTTLGVGSREHLTELSSAMSMGSAESQGLLANLTERMTALGVADPEGAARKAVFGMLQHEALTLTFGDAFAMVAVACFVAAIMAQFSKPRRPSEFGQPLPSKAEAH